MFTLIPYGTKYDFLGKAPTFLKVSLGVFLASLVWLSTVGIKLGLDFAGGHEVLLAFEKQVAAEDVRGRLETLFPGVDVSVQSYEVPTEPSKVFFLSRIQRSESFGEAEITALEQAYQGKYGPAFKRLRYNAEAGDVVALEFVAGSTRGADLSAAALQAVAEGTKHEVRLVRQVGRPEQLRYEVVLKGVDASVVQAMTELDPAVKAAKVEFVGPTVGKQLRDDGILAVGAALLLILVYIAFRFDIYFAPGAILCLFHDAIVTMAVLALIGEQFSLATIAGILTLVGYSINDTIVVFDRIRETMGNARGAELREVVNRSVNETLGRTVMTAGSTLLACVCLMIFGSGTVLASFGLIMTIGIVLGTYSSVYVAAPVFVWLRENYGPREDPSTKTPPRDRSVAVV